MTRRRSAAAMACTAVLCVAATAGACDRNDGRELAAVSTTTTAALAGPETAGGFVGRLAAAIDAPDHAFLVARLHPEVVALYGEDVCRNHVTAAFDSSASATVVGVGEPGPWTWSAAGKQIELSDAVAATLDVTIAGRTQRETLHVAVADGLFRWFSDCKPTALPGG